MKPIYKPKGAAAEYGDYAVNIYNGLGLLHQGQPAGGNGKA